MKFQPVCRAAATRTSKRASNDTAASLHTLEGTGERSVQTEAKDDPVEGTAV
jgi:hypothetical protein